MVIARSNIDVPDATTPVVRLSPLVTRVLAPNPSKMTLTGTNSYLIGHDEVAVIDPGPDLPEHVERLASLLRQAGRPAVALVTHHHDDHLPAARRLRERLGIPIAGHVNLPSVDRPLGDGEAVWLAGATLVALHTPGHTPDHVCYILEEEHAAFTGDLVAGTGTVVVGDAPGALADYLQSLEVVARREPDLLYPGHGPVVRDPQARLSEYREHRLLRERQVIGVLGAGPATIAEIVASIYVDVRPELHMAAGRNVRSHLYKLEAEGRAAQHDNRWSLVELVT
ncbi:MAG: MBL fold metallo-hydrolase [Chloroflexi bacterium]|nr:MBL fold metallo-hydrolase [Chloroflexota bacterium]